MWKVFKKSANINCSYLKTCEYFLRTLTGGHWLRSGHFLCGHMLLGGRGVKCFKNRNVRRTLIVNDPLREHEDCTGVSNYITDDHAVTLALWWYRTAWYLYYWRSDKKGHELFGSQSGVWLCTVSPTARFIVYRWSVRHNYPTHACTKRKVR